MNANKIISPDNKCFDYMGRIDFENPERPMFIWAGSNTQTIFTGKSLSVIVRNYAFQKDAHFGVVIDGVFHKIFLKNSTDDEIYTICDNLENGEHTLEIIKNDLTEEEKAEVEKIRAKAEERLTKAKETYDNAIARAEKFARDTIEKLRKERVCAQQAE